jgi:SAM-dependent methyltransferase
MRAWGSDRVVWDYVSHAGVFPDEVFSIAAAWSSVRGDVLDIGVGTGRTVPFLSAFARQYTAIDYAEGMVTACRRRYPDVTVTRGDARQLDFAADSFSFVMFSFNGIDYVHPDERAKVIKEIHRVLKPGGHFAFSSHNLNALRTQSHGFRIRWPVKTKNPIRYGIRLLRTARENLSAFKNYNRLHDLEFVKENIAFVNDGSHDFAYVTCYIDHRKQEQDLRDAGFEDVTIVGRDGRPIGSSPGDEWLSYLVRKPGRSPAT